MMDTKTGTSRLQNRERTSCTGLGKSKNVLLEIDLENQSPLMNCLFPKLNIRENKCFEQLAAGEVDNYSDKTCVDLQTYTVSKSEETRQENSLEQVSAASLSYLQEVLNGSGLEIQKVISKNILKTSHQPTSETLNDEDISIPNSNHHFENDSSESFSNNENNNFYKHNAGVISYASSSKPMDNENGQKQKKGVYYKIRPRHGKARLHILLVFMLLVILVSSAEGVPSECTVPKVHEGDSIELTCKIGVDVSQQRMTVNLDYVSDNSSIVTVAAVYWPDSDMKNITKPGYKLTKYVFKHNETILIFHIHGTSKNLSGNYSCEALGPDKKEIKPCKLPVTEKEEALPREMDKEGAVPIRVYVVWGFACVIYTVVLIIIIFVLCNPPQINSKSAQHPSIETSPVNVTVDNITKGVQEESDAKNPLIGGIPENENGHTQSDAKDPLIGGIPENENENDHTQSDEEETILLTHILN